MLRSRFRTSVIATPSPGDDTTAWLQMLMTKQSNKCNHIVYSPVYRKVMRCTGETTVDPNTHLWHFRHEINQYGPTTIHHDVLWPIRKKQCQNWQHRTSNSHRAAREENSFTMRDIEVNLSNPGLMLPQSPKHAVKSETCADLCKTLVMIFSCSRTECLEAQLRVR